MIYENAGRVKVDLPGVYRVGNADTDQIELSTEDIRFIENELFDYLIHAGYEVKAVGCGPPQLSFDR